MLRSLSLFLALSTTVLAQSFTWGGSGSTTTSGASYSVVASASGADSANPTVTLKKESNVVATAAYVAQYNGSDLVAASPVHFSASAMAPGNVPFSSTYAVTVNKGSMTPPTSANATINALTNWSPIPAMTAPAGNGTGALMFSVAGYTNWGTAAWTPPAAGTYSFFVSQHGDSDHTGNNNDPLVGDIEVNGSGYTLTVAKIPPPTATITPTSQTVPVGSSITFTAGGGAGTGAYVWGGSASGTGGTTTVTFNSTGTFSVTVYHQGDTNYNDSNLATSTITVSGYALSVTNGSGGGTFALGAAVPISANLPAGYNFQGWSASPAGGAFGNAGSASTTYTMPSSNETLQWTKVPSVPNAQVSNIGMDHFDITWSTNPGLTYNVVVGGAQWNNCGTPFHVTGLTPNTTYYVAVQAVDLTSQSGWASGYVTTAPDTQPPSVPGGLTATSVNASNYTVSWASSTDNVVVDHYELLVNNVNIGGTTGLSATLGASPTTAYSVQVRSVDNSGNASAWSSVVSFTTPSDTTAPTVPQRLRASAVSVSTFNLMWDPSGDDVGTTQYQVYQNGTLLASTSSPNYQVTGLATDTSYTFTVRAADAANNWSGQSNPVTITTNSPILLGIHAAGYGTGTGQTLTLTSYEDTIAQNSALAMATNASGTGASSWTVAHQYRGFSAGVDNILKVSGPSYQREVRFEVPAGYTLLVAANGNPEVPYTNTATIDLGNANGASTDSATITFSLMPTDGTTALDAGYAIDPEISISNVVWAMSLGRTPDGLTLGALTLRKTDIVGDPISTDTLKLTGTDQSASMHLYSDSQLGGGGGAARRMIWTPNCWIWLDDHATGSQPNYFEIKAYDAGATPSWNGSTYVFTKSGSAVTPFARYAVSNGATNNTIMVTKNVGQSTALTWTLDKAVSGSTTTWTLQRANQRKLVTVETVSGNTTTQVITLTDAAGTAAQTFQKVYQMMPWNKRELVSEADDPNGANLVTTYTYGTSGGAYGKLLSTTKPDGTYVAYDYYSDDANYGNLAHTYTRWLDVASTAATANAGNAEVVTLTYAPVHGFECDALSSTTTTVPGTGGTVTISKTLRNPDFTSTTFNGHKVRKETIQAYYNATSFLTTTRLSYHPDETANDRENQLISETGPTGTKISTIYYSGYFHDNNDSNSTLFNSVSAGGTSGFGEYKFNGFSTQVTGSVLVNTYDGQPIDPIYLVPNRSTIELTAIIGGVPKYKVNYVFTGASGGVPSFEFIGMEKLVVTTTVDPNSGIATTTKTDSTHTGAQTVQTFTNGRLMSEMAMDGSTITYGYDSTGLLTSKAVNGVSASGNYAATGTVYTYYTYDAASRKISEKTSSSSDSNAAGLTTSYHYDSAGRLDQQTDATGLVTTLAYNLTNHTTTSTLPGGSTKVVTTYADGTTKSVTGTAVVGQYTNIVVNADGTITKTAYSLRSSDVSNPTAAPRWARSTADWLGRATRSETPAIGGTIAKLYTYNAKGELTTVSTVDGTSGTKLVADAYTDYNAYEVPYRSGSDLDGTADLQTGSASDRITDTDSVYQKDASNVWWLVTTAQAYNQASIGTSVTTGTTKVRQNQFAAAGTNVESETVSIDVFGNQADTKTTIDRANFLMTTTTTVPNSSTPVIAVTRNALKVSDQDAEGHVTTYAYDSLRRLVCASDPRIDGSALAKDLAPRVGYYDGTAPVGARYQKAWTKDPAGNQTTYSYSSTTGQLSAVQSPSIGTQPGKFTYYAYSHRGETIRTWGSMTYPVEYALDDYGEKIAMRTFRGTTDFTTSTWPLSDDGADASNPDPASWASGDKTTWTYDTATGALLSKVDAAGKSIGYAYTELGQVRTKTWARGVSIAYKYFGDDAGDLKTGELKSLDYSDTPSTNPDVSYTYDRLGKPLTVTDATGSRTFAYSATDTTLTSETLPALFNSSSNARLLTQKYDTTGTGTKGRSTGFSLGTSSATTADYDVTYGYDTYGRAGSVTSAGATFTYGYTAGSNLIGSVADNGTYTMNRTWMSNRNLLQSIDTKMGTTSKATFAYAADEWGRRTSAIRSGEVYSRYINQGLITTWSYDDRSQVTGAQTYYGTSLSDLSYPVEGRSYGFSFDNIGNRLTSSVDGRSTTYNSNNLNQITDRVTPGTVDVSGFAPTGSTVSVTAQGSGQTVDRQGDYYHSAAAVSNSSAPANASISITSTTPSSTITRKTFVPKYSLLAAEQWTYDLDGNLTQDDEWTYTWDAENRLTAMQTRSDLITAGVFAAADARRLEFTYDYLGRRAEKIVRAGWNGSLYTTVQSDTRFVYHGWNLVGQFEAGSSTTLTRTFTWGLDLSGTLAGDGGTGGLLMTQEGANQYVYAYDGNGNVSAVMNRSGGTTVAEYEYGAFGEPLRASNTYAQTNPFRFSTQYADNETGLLYYGHRYYNPQVGRFVGRDHTEEAGGLNLYAFCGNNSVNRWDLLGDGDGDYVAPPCPTGADASLWYSWYGTAELAATHAAEIAWGEARAWHPPMGVDASSAVAHDISASKAGEGVCMDWGNLADWGGVQAAAQSTKLLAAIDAGFDTAGKMAKVQTGIDKAVSTAIDGAVSNLSNAANTAIDNYTAGQQIQLASNVDNIVGNMAAQNAATASDALTQNLENAQVDNIIANATTNSSGSDVTTNADVASGAVLPTGSSAPTATSAPTSTVGSNRSDGSALGALTHAGAVVGNALLDIGATLVHTGAAVTRTVVHGRGPILDAYENHLLTSGIQPKVQFDVPFAPGAAGSQSLTVDSHGNRVYSVDGALLGGFLIAGGEVFPIYGSKDAQSNWSLGGSGGKGVVFGIDVRFNNFRPTYFSGYFGLGYGESGKLEWPSLSTNIFTGTINNKGEVSKEWFGGG